VSFPDILGAIGVATIIVAYVLLQTERMRSEQMAYSLMNAVGAALILFSLWFSPNLPSVVVESFWLLISLFGIGKHVGRKPDR
jgi:multisubunit Na+/H+ antiporter MnhB subunit